MWPFTPNIQRLRAKGKFHRLVSVFLRRQEPELQQAASQALLELANGEVAAALARQAVWEVLSAVYSLETVGQRHAAWKRAVDLLVRMGNLSVDALKYWLYFKNEGTLWPCYRHTPFDDGCSALVRIGTSEALHFLLERLSNLTKDECSETYTMLDSLSHFNRHDLVGFSKTIYEQFQS